MDILCLLDEIVNVFSHGRDGSVGENGIRNIKYVNADSISVLNIFDKSVRNYFLFVHGDESSKSVAAEWLDDGGEFDELKEDVVNTAMFARSTIEVLRHHLDMTAFACKDYLSFLKTVHSWNSTECGFEKIAKYVTAYPLAKFLKNELPPTPKSFKGNPLVFQGKIYQYLKTRLTGGVSFVNNKTKPINKKNLSLWWSYLQGIKRGCNSVSEDFLLEAYRKHGKIIMNDPESQFDPYSFEELTFKLNFSDYADRFCSKFSEPQPRLFEATASAALGTNRSNGGARELVRDVLQEKLKDIKYNKRGEIEELPLKKFKRRDLIKLEDSIYKDKDIDDPIWNFYTRVNGAGQMIKIPGTEYIRLPVRETSDTVVTQDFLNYIPISSEEFTQIYGLSCPKLKDVIEYAKKEPITVRVHAVSEPLKARLITKGPSFRYWISRFFQKAMWQYLQGYVAFSLTGRPLLISDLNLMVARAKKMGFVFTSFVSGDYSAATDGLDINFTKICFESFLAKCNYSGDLNEILRSVIYEHFITYPEWTEIESFLQKNGQLMGSTLSFPILCMVNFICYWKSMEEYAGFRINIHDLPVLVNGDDILFPSNDVLYKIWLNNIQKVGFKLSVGKNYVHHSVLTINSQCFSYSYGTDSFLPIKFVNCGLLTGQSKKGGSVSSRSDQSLTSIYNELIENSPDPVRTHKRFLFYYKDIVKQHTEFGGLSMNLFADINYGGLGFKNDLIEPNFTETQRLMGALNERNIKQAVAELDLKKMDRFKIMVPQDSSYKITKKFTKNIALSMKMVPLNKGELDFKPESASLPLLALMKNEIFDSASEPRLHHPKLKHKIFKNSQEDKTKRLYPIKSDLRLKNWPYKIIILNKDTTELPDICL